MSRLPRNSGKPWSNADIKKLRELAGKETTREIARILGRSTSAVYAKASELGISLLPIDKSRRKK